MENSNILSQCNLERGEEMKYLVAKEKRKRWRLMSLFVGIMTLVGTLLSSAQEDGSSLTSKQIVSQNHKQVYRGSDTIQVNIYQKQYFEGSFETSQTGLNGWHQARDQAWIAYTSTLSGSGSLAGEPDITPYGVGQFGKIWEPWYGGWKCVYGGGYYLAHYTLNLENLSGYSQAKLLIEYYDPQITPFELWNGFYLEVYIKGEKAGEKLIDSAYGEQTEIPLEIDKVQTGSDVEVMLKSNRFKVDNPLSEEYAGYSFRACEGIAPGPTWGPMWLVLDSCGSISGYVKFEDGTPIDSILVQAFKDDTLMGFDSTDIDGYYKIECLSPNIYKVRACFDNNGVIVRNYHNEQKPSEADVEVTAGSETSDINIIYPLPVVMVHGIFPGNPATWNTARTYFQQDPAIRDDGTKAHICSVASGFATMMQRLEWNEAVLARFIDQNVILRFSPNVPKIDILAYSQGGLFSRIFIHRHDIDQNVSKLLMLGTPNGGWHTAERWPFRLWPGFQDMTIRSMQGFNMIITEKRKASFYYFAGRGGRRGVWHERERVPPDTCSYPYWYSDGVVGEWSVFNCISMPAYCFSDAEHTQLHQHPYIDNVLRVLEDKPYSAPCNGALAEDNHFTVIEDSIQFSPAIEDSISAGEAKQYQIVVDASQQVSFSLNWIFGELDLVLYDPYSSLIDSAVAASDPEIEYVPYDSLIGLPLEQYSIQNPVSGTWTLEVSAMNTPADSTVLFFVMAAMKNTLSLSIATDNEYYSQTEPVLIIAALTESGSPKTEASAYAIIMRPNYSIDSLDLFDDGTHNDGSANDGVYGNSYTNTTMGGRYLLSITASGLTSGGEQFEREEILEFDVNPATATFTGSYSDQGVDADGDSYFDSLRIELGLQIDSAGDYEIVGTLVDSNGTEIDIGNSSATGLSQGTHTFILDFSGQKIRQNGVDGPYYLKNLALFDETHILIQADYKENAYTTSPYTISQFTSVEEEVVATPKAFTLFQNYPNPFNPQTIIEYVLPKDTYVKLTIYNILGQKVKTLVDEYQSAGRKYINWNGKDEKGNGVASGIYFYKIQTKEFTQVKKMAIIK